MIIRLRRRFGAPSHMSRPLPSPLGSDGKSRLLIECTYVFSQPWVHSGIQRVVRNIASECPGVSTERPVILVALAKDRVVEVSNLLPANRFGMGHLARAYAWLQRLRAAISRRLSEADGGISELPIVRRLVLKLAFFAAGPPIACLRLLGLDPFFSRAKAFGPRQGDILLLLDSSWHDPAFLRQVKDLKNKGIRIIAVVYDLIPIRNPEYCVSNIAVVLNNWIDKMLSLAEGFICISQWVSTEVQDEVSKRVGNAMMRGKAYGWFHLGSELDRKTQGYLVSDPIRNCFAGPNPKFLVVGTIEPRKNHTTILNAFDRHWALGGGATLCVIGRKGWMCDAIVARLRKHPENGKKLFWFDNANDNDLEFAYQNADALIFSSYVEGFGLPLVEGLQRGLPAIASDIPVFREVAGDFAEYFDPNSASELCSIVNQFSVTKKLPNARPVTEWKWITWRESAQQLFDAVDQCCRELDERQSLSNANKH